MCRVGDWLLRGGGGTHNRAEGSVGSVLEENFVTSQLLGKRLEACSNIQINQNIHLMLAYIDSYSFLLVKLTESDPSTAR